MSSQTASQTIVKYLDKRQPRESLYSLPSSEPLEETKTTTETTKPSVKPKSPHVDYVDRFKVFYEARAKNENGEPMKFKQDRHHFVIAQKLIKEFGLDALVTKTRILARLCDERAVWFTKGGWGDFSIEKISKQWNGILGEAMPDPKAELQDGLRKAREERERADKIMGR